uniref:Uncharacterized protein n=1 Tax=Oryza punctata TaxID=4537 RepID=A0A0E0M2R5_ORYPU
MGHFDDNYDELNFSSGSVGVVNYNTTLKGGPVFNLNAELVGVNYSKRSRKNMFFAFDINQLVEELNWLLGSNWMVIVRR